MKFKLSYVFFPILLVLLLMVTACSKGNSSLEDFDIEESELYGTWRVVRLGDLKVDENDSNEDWIAVVRSNGSAYCNGHEMTYDVSGNIITFYYESILWGELNIRELNNAHAEGILTYNNSVKEISLIKLSDEVVPPTINAPSEVAEGEYKTFRVTNMLDLPPNIPFTPVEDKVSLKINAATDTHVNITIPTTTYVFSGQEMVIPNFTISNIPVLDAGEEGVAIVNHTFKENVGGKIVSGTLKAEISHDGELTLEISYRYGSMPFAIMQEYKTFNDNAISGKAAGTYMTHRTTNMVGLPPQIPFNPIEENVSVNIKAATDTHVNITIPTMTYVFSGQNMEIPDFTISNIPVLDAGDEGVVIVNHEFKENVGGKEVTGTLKAEIEPDGDLDMEVTFKYGSMPFALKQDYESLHD